MTEPNRRDGQKEIAEERSSNEAKELKMKNHNDLIGPVSVAILILLATWGNAIAMAIVSAIMSVAVAFFVLRRHPRGDVKVTFMLISCSLAAVVAFFLTRTR